MRRANVLLLSGCLGYEDLNDHDELCRDRLLALLCDRDDLTVQVPCLDSDRRKPLAGESTLNRLELAPLEGAEGEYKRIVVEPAKIAALLVNRYKVEVTVLVKAWAILRDAATPKRKCGTAFSSARPWTQRRSNHDLTIQL